MDLVVSRWFSSTASVSTLAPQDAPNGVWMAPAALVPPTPPAPPPQRFLAQTLTSNHLFFISDTALSSDPTELTAAVTLSHAKYFLLLVTPALSVPNSIFWFTSTFSYKYLNLCVGETPSLP